MGNNVAYTWQPKFKNPFAPYDDGTVYLVPAVKNQTDPHTNFVVVCCSPSYNGLYAYPTANLKNYKVWNNNGTTAYYVPITDCKYVGDFDYIKEHCPHLLDTIIKEQKKFLKYQRENVNANYKVPEWFIKKERKKKNACA